jgi:hypothetical protein
LAAVLAFAGCRKWTAPDFPTEPELPNTGISGLLDYFPSPITTVVSRDIIIAGRVISSDRAGNFYNTFLIDDGSGAVEIMAGMPDLHTVYRSGQRVVVRVGGLAVGWRDGVMQIGLPPEPGSRYATGYFYHPAVIRTHVTAEHSVADVAPIETTLAELSPELCGRLVRIAGLKADFGEAELEDGGLDAPAATWAVTRPTPQTGYVKFRSSPADNDDDHTPINDLTSADDLVPADSLTVSTSGYASFAAAPVPLGSVTLTGILFHGPAGTSKAHYYLKLRDEKDITIY